MATNTGDTQAESGFGRALTETGAARVVVRWPLIDLLARAARVTVISAPPGSGKTVLLRTWSQEAGVNRSAARVSVHRDERNAQRFWTEILDALRATEAGAAIVRPLTAAPAFDGWAVVERLLEDLAPLRDGLWLVMDDLHELCVDDALRQLELLLLRAPEKVRFVLASRHDLRLGLHRLRLEGELTEIRGDDLRFTFDESRVLMQGAGIDISDGALAMIVEKTEGWAAGIRLAALSLARHPDAERFAADLSGSERTIAEYLFAEVLDREPDEVRRLLVRTSILNRVNGVLADLLTGDTGGERILQQLEDENAFVVALDPVRTWFRYHHLFADLLRLELRRTEPQVSPSLHATAAEWHAAHGFTVEAIRHAQAAQDWTRAARLLFDQWFGLELDGKADTAHELLAGFPRAVVATDAELTALLAADQLINGSIEEAARYLALAAAASSSVAEHRTKRYDLTLCVLRLTLARRRGDLRSVDAEANAILAPGDLVDGVDPELGADLRALALLSLGVGELLSMRIDSAGPPLEGAISLARRIDRPFVELTALAYASILDCLQSSQRAVDRGRQAIELARRHGWTNEPITAAAWGAVGVSLAWEGRLDEAETWLDRTEQVMRPELFPVIGLLAHYARGLFELAHGDDERALAAFKRVERAKDLVVAPIAIAIGSRAFMMHALVRLGDIEQAEQIHAQMDEDEREDGRTRTAVAAIRLAQGDPEAATVALKPVVADAMVLDRVWAVHGLLLEAIAQDGLGHGSEATAALEQALDVAEPDAVRWPFLVHPAPALLQRHRRRGTSHAALVSDILDLLAGQGPPPRASAGLTDPLTDSETRVLRYLPTNLSAPDIASQLHVTTNTVKTHLRHLYAKLAVHNRNEAVERARALGLVAPNSRPA